MDNLQKFDAARLHVDVFATVSQEPAPKSTGVGRHHTRRRFGKPQFMPDVPWEFFRRMVSLPGKAGWVGLAIYRKTVMKKTMTLMFSSRVLAQELGINSKAVSFALTKLEEAAVITTVRKRGRFATVTLLNDSET